LSSRTLFFTLSYTVHNPLCLILFSPDPSTKQLGGANDVVDFTNLQLPRRPEWDKGTSAEELNSREKTSFLDWRRKIAIMEDEKPEEAVTPFEKNLEVWRQLWRVIERSNVVVQIVDSRNPLFYRSEDLEAYVEEVHMGQKHGNKKSILLLNKADYLTVKQREAWARFFQKNGIDFIFFSAIEEQEKIDEEAHQQRQREILEDLEAERAIGRMNNPLQKALEEVAEDAARSNGEGGGEGATTTPQESNGQAEESAAEFSISHIYTRDELELYFQKVGNDVRNQGLAEGETPSTKCTIGMIGYPNVGKSSVINVMLKASKHSHGLRVGVASTPGKTKHFQTLVISESVTLCDCPGLVFPSFMSSKPEMVLAGVIPLRCGWIWWGLGGSRMMAVGGFQRVLFCHTSGGRHCWF
jgi:large subunit GTPase 1